MAKTLSSIKCKSVLTNKRNVACMWLAQSLITWLATDQIIICCDWSLFWTLLLQIYAKQSKHHRCCLPLISNLHLNLQIHAKQSKHHRCHLDLNLQMHAKQSEHHRCCLLLISNLHASKHQPWHRGNVLSHLHITRVLRVSHTHQQLVANLQPAGGAYSLVDSRAACRLLGT